MFLGLAVIVRQRRHFADAQKNGNPRPPGSPAGKVSIWECVGGHRILHEVAAVFSRMNVGEGTC